MASTLDHRKEGDRNDTLISFPVVSSCSLKPPSPAFLRFQHPFVFNKFSVKTMSGHVFFPSTLITEENNAYPKEATPLVNSRLDGF